VIRLVLLVELSSKRRPWSQAVAPKTVHRHVSAKHSDTKPPYKATEKIGHRHPCQVAQRTKVAPITNDTRGRDTAAHTGFHAQTFETIVAALRESGDQRGRSHTGACNSCEGSGTERRTRARRITRVRRRHLAVRVCRRRGQSEVVQVALYCRRTKCPLCPHVPCEGPPHGIPADQENRQAPLVRG